MAGAKIKLVISSSWAVQGQQTKLGLVLVNQ